MPQSERFERLYQAHAGTIRAYTRRRADPATADEVAAEVFVIAWRRLDDIPDDPLPWLLGVARRVLANRRRSIARDQALRARIMFQQSTADPTEAARNESDGAVLRALSRLKERDREVLLLIGWEGLAHAQAGRVLGVHPATVAARLYRAKRRFAQSLSKETGDRYRENGPREAEAI